jgi:SAM-dependent methyltransferase
MTSFKRLQIYNHRKEFLFKYLKGGNILDIGNIGGICADGNSSSFHFEIITKCLTSTVYGLDLFPPPAVDKYLYKNQKQHDLNNPLPYKDDFFDTVYMGEVLEHLGNPLFTLQEIQRCLKPKGVFVFDVPNPYSINRILKYTLSRKEDLGDCTHLIFYTPAALSRLITYAGFELIEMATNWKLGKKYSIIPRKFRSGLGYNLLVSCKIPDE